MKNPYAIVTEFEEAIAEYCGSKYAVAVESGTAAIFLSLMYRRKKIAMGRSTFMEVFIPKRTYPSVPCSIIHAGFRVKFTDDDWQGEYELAPLNIWDSALRFKRKMYHGGLQCLSMHIKKSLPVGRGGAILTDDLFAVKWLRLARFDGREPVPLQQQKDFTVLGYNMYMEPVNAARGIQLMQALGDRELLDLSVADQKYSDLSQFPIYTQ